MPKASSKETCFYGVKVGRVPGVYATWDECQKQTSGYPKALQKKFSTFEEANAFVNGMATRTAQTKVERHQRHAYAAGPRQPGWDQTPRDSWESPGSGTNAVNVHQMQRNMSQFGTASEATTSSKPKINTLDNATQADEEEWETIIVYTDGACKQNGKVDAVAGIGVWWGPHDERNLSERCPGDQTNNRAELIAIIRALETAPSEEALSPVAASKKRKTRWIIRTDSRYSIQVATEWAPKWERNNWRLASGQEAKNVPLIQYLMALLDLRGMDEPVKFEWVRGHQGDVGNEAADRLAVNGTQLPMTPERDWAVARQDIEKTCSEALRTRAREQRPKQVETNTASGQTAELPAEEEDLWNVQSIDAKELIDFVFSEDDLLNQEQLELLEETQDF